MFSSTVPASSPNSGAVDLNIPTPVSLFPYPRQPCSHHVSHQEVTEHTSYWSVITCPVFCSPVNTVLFFPLIHTPHCPLLMSHLFCLALLTVFSHAVSSSPLSLQPHPYMSHSTTSHAIVSSTPSSTSVLSSKSATFY